MKVIFSMMHSYLYKTDMNSNCVNFVYVCVHRLLKEYDKIWYIIYAKKNRFVKKNKNH